MAVTLKDIAQRVGVDQSTVSLALNDKTASKLSADRVRQIRSMSTRLGYRPNIAARQLRNRKTHCIGVVMNYLEYYPYSHYFNLISEYCSDRGYHAVPLPMKHRDGRPVDEIELIENAGVDGLIVLEYDPTTEAYFRRRSQQTGPVVFRSTGPRVNALEKHHRIQTDYSRAVCDLIGQIVQRGWDRMYLLVERDATRPNPLANEHGLLPYEAMGVADAERETGIDLSLPEQIIHCDARWAKSRYEAVSAFLETHTLQPGTCLLQCGADGSSGTYAALANAGLTVGVDVAVAATTATPPWEYVLPATTTCTELHESISRWLVETTVSLVEATSESPEIAGPSLSENTECRVTLTDSVPQRR